MRAGFLCGYLRERRLFDCLDVLGKVILEWI